MHTQTSQPEPDAEQIANLRRLSSRLKQKIDQNNAIVDSLRKEAQSIARKIAEDMESLEAERQVIALRHSELEVKEQELIAREAKTSHMENSTIRSSNLMNL